MKKNIFTGKLYASIAIAASAMVSLSCTDNLFESGNDDLPQSTHFFVIGSASTGTRVNYTDESYTESTFADGDEVRVYQLSNAEGSSVVKSALYKIASNTDGSKYLTPSGSETVPQYNGTTYAFVYPAPSAETSIAALSHTVQANQNSKQNFEASDLLWDVVTASDNKATIEMDHAMAQIIVETDENVAGETATLTLTGSPAVSISGLNLTYGKEEENWCTNATTAEGSEKTSVTMWNYGNNADQNRIFRAVVPAQTLSAAKFLTIGSKSYKLEEALPVSGGNNYILHINKNTTNPDQPEINDDDSWVLDVLDPETGEPVGLLCREYLRYQPENLSQDFDYNTNTDNGSNSKWINSQAWVFYNLQDFTTRIPNLNTGTVLRFIFDFQKPGYVWWPVAEGHNYIQHGIFSPVHGANWCSPFNDYSDNTAGGHEIYENGKPKITEYYMHGGTITWDGINNKISRFDMPTKKITCAEAEKHGHIAIDDQDKNNIKVYVSYDETESSGIKKGILVPHNLIDKRGTEINKYPLVKIGYNQFWMSKSLNTKTLTDGTELTCYNKRTGGPGVTFTEQETMSAGYMYPYVIGAVDDDNSKKNYDPVNDDTQMAGYGNFKPLPMYNNLCLLNDKFLPSSTDNRLYYIIPSPDEIKSMSSYFGKYFGAKMMSRYCTNKIIPNQDQSFAYSNYQSILRGEFRGGAIGTMQNMDPANAYTANVSGFNCRAIGYYDITNNIVNGVTGTSFIQLKPKNQQQVSQFIFNVYNAWNDTQAIQDWSRSWDNRATQYFGQVRFVMKFKNQADNGGSTRAAETERSKSAVNVKSKTIYANLVEAE